MRKTNSKGFTIIELLVVIVIIGILVALALPQLFAAQARGRDTERKNDLKNIKTQLETYFNDTGHYPETTIDQLDTFENGVLNLNEADIEAPRDNVPPYVYTPSTGGNTYTLEAELENENDSALDDDGNYIIRSVNQEAAEVQTP